MTVLMQSVKAASPQTAVLSKSADPTQTDAPASQKGEQPGGEISFDLLMALLQATTNVTPQASLQDGSKAFQSTKTAAVKQAAPVNLPGASSKLQSIELPLAANVSQLPRTGLGTQVPDTRNVSQQPRTATASQLPLYMQPEVQASSIWQSQRTGESEPSANSASSEVGSQTGLRLVTQASPTAGDSTQGAVSTTSPAAKTGVPERLIQMLRNAGVPDEDVGAVTTQTSTAQSPPVAYKPLLSVQSLQSDKGDKGKQSIDSANNPLAQKVHEAQSGTASAEPVNGMSQRSAATPTVEEANANQAVWSASSTDASRQFATLLANHVQSTAAPKTLSVQVHPQGMGTLTVTVAQHQAGMDVQIQASNAQTASWLQTETGRLTQAVELAGLPVNSVQVSVSTGHGGQQKGQGQGDDAKRMYAITNRQTSAGSEPFQLDAPLSSLDGTAQSISIRA